MTREFWIWQWVDGEFYDAVFESKAQCDTYFQRLGAEGHPVQLVPKAAIETAQKDVPTWHDAPTCAGLWVLDDGTALVLESGTLPKEFDGLRWYGPIPQDTAMAAQEQSK